MTNWVRLRDNASKLALDFRHDDLIISNAELLRCVDTLSEYIPDDRLTKKIPSGESDFIRSWTDQILNATKKESLAAVAVVTATAHAYESVAKLPGSKFLISEIPKHQAIGLFDQLLITYFLSKYIQVTAVEQDKNRVDIVAEVNERRLNIHVKGIDPHTKDRAQIEAFRNLTRAIISKPIINANGESLEVIQFDGYVPGGIQDDFWSKVWDEIVSNPVTYFEVTMPGGSKEPDSLVKLWFSWEANRSGLRGEINGVNAFQQAMNRINDVNDGIPPDSQDIELVILISRAAKHLEVGDGVLPKRRLDGVMAVAVNPGTLGYYFERSSVNLKYEINDVADILERALPESAWIC